MNKHCSTCSMPDVDGPLWLVGDALMCGACLRNDRERYRAALQRIADGYEGEDRLGLLEMCRIAGEALTKP